MFLKVKPGSRVPGQAESEKPFIRPDSGRARRPRVRLSNDFSRSDAQCRCAEMVWRFWCRSATAGLRIGPLKQLRHDGHTLRHTPPRYTPLRLSMFIEAPRAAIDAVMVWPRSGAPPGRQRLAASVQDRTASQRRRAASPRGIGSDCARRPRCRASGGRHVAVRRAPSRINLQRAAFD